MTKITINIFSILIVIFMANSIKIRYIVTEHPKVTHLNHKYVSYANLTSQRYGRKDPFYYVGLHMNFMVPMGNNITISFYFYEFLSNRYKRGFVEMIFGLCDLIKRDMFFGTALRQGRFLEPCPFQPGEYHLYNMTIPLKHIPHNFPFTKGRIYCNFTVTSTKEMVGGGYIDMEIKETRI